MPPDPVARARQNRARLPYPFRGLSRLRASRDGTSRGHRQRPLPSRLFLPSPSPYGGCAEVAHLRVPVTSQRLSVVTRTSRCIRAVATMSSYEVAGRKCREAHCLGDDFWSEREDVHVAGDGVVEPCFEIAVEGQAAELMLLAHLPQADGTESERLARVREDTAVPFRPSRSDSPRAPRPSARSSPRRGRRPRDPSRRAAVAVLPMHAIENHSLQRHPELRQRARHLVHHAKFLRLFRSANRRRRHAGRRGPGGIGAAQRASSAPAGIGPQRGSAARGARTA